jgi:hypothetical protein
MGRRRCKSSVKHVMVAADNLSDLIKLTACKSKLATKPALIRYMKIISAVATTRQMADTGNGACYWV